MDSQYNKAIRYRTVRSNSNTGIVSNTSSPVNSPRLQLNQSNSNSNMYEPESPRHRLINNSISNTNNNNNSNNNISNTHTTPVTINVKLHNRKNSKSNDDDYIITNNKKYKLLSYYYKLPKYQRIILLLFSLLLLISYITSIIISRIVLYMSTDSVFYHDYTWYSVQNTVRRVYDQYFIPNTIDQLTDEAIYMKQQNSCRILENHTRNVLKTHIAPTPVNSHIHIYVLVHPIDFDIFPWIWDTILIQYNHNNNNTYYTEASAANICNIYENDDWLHNIQQCNIYIHDKVNDLNTLPSYCYRMLRYNKLIYTFQIITMTKQLQPDILNDITRILIIGDLFERRTYNELYEQYVISRINIPSQLSIGLITMSNEGCNNDNIFAHVVQNNDKWPEYTLHHTLGYHTTMLAQTYGDCMLEQVFPLYMHWPLGPQTKHTFPTHTNVHNTKNITQRNILYNLQVTFQSQKPTRMQAWLIANEYCNNLYNNKQYSDLSCYIRTSDLLFKIVSEIDKSLGTSLHLYWPFTDNVQIDYLPTLYNSRYTLCPAGKNPYESYRLYESLMTGSIPIVENMDIDNLVLHSQSLRFRCRNIDSFDLFKKTNAPVLYVNQWNELPELLNNVNETYAIQLQNDIIKYYDKFVIYLRNTLLDNIVKM